MYLRSFDFFWSALIVVPWEFTKSIPIRWHFPASCYLYKNLFFWGTNTFSWNLLNRKETGCGSVFNPHIFSDTILETLHDGMVWILLIVINCRMKFLENFRKTVSILKKIAIEMFLSGLKKLLWRQIGSELQFHTCKGVYSSATTKTNTLFVCMAMK